ncbi:hypothetical protein NDU88_002350 [Pleurodeles waltl]|uniref:Uncharacterized protein n=1 Tax=Pleurodeles waltl TaxID=8319 RepID=A0AAV7TKY4_PLEWA|nr:hypothetical protein NDU88_002350 [Pleurodeles waltl]
MDPRLTASWVSVREHRAAVALKRERERARAHSSGKNCTEIRQQQYPSESTTFAFFKQRCYLEEATRRYNVSSRASAAAIGGKTLPSRQTH